MNKKKMYNKNRSGLVDKTVVLGIALVFVFGAFIPAVNSQNELNMDGQSPQESEKSEIYPEESVADEINIMESTDSKIDISKTSGGSLLNRFLTYLVDRLADILGDRPIIDRLRELFAERDVNSDADEITIVGFEGTHGDKEDATVDDSSRDIPPVGDPSSRAPTFYDGQYRIPSNYAELVSWYLMLEQNFSDYIDVFKANELYGTGTVPKNGGGSYDLYYVKVTNFSLSDSKPEVFFDGGPHGNEKIGAIGRWIG